MSELDESDWNADDHDGLPVWFAQWITGMTTTLTKLAKRVENLEKHHHYIPGHQSTSPMIHRETFDGTP
jgi:hypothetical protein